MDEEKYRDICNTKTIYSEKKGFFENFIVNMTEMVGDEWIETLNSPKENDENRLVNCLKNRELSHALQSVYSNVQEIFQQKSDSGALQRFQEARRTEEAGNLAHSMVLVNQALVRATKSGKVYQDCLIFRILLSMKLRRFSDALHDLHLCLKEKLDPEQKLAVYKRMLDCHVGLKDFNRARLTMSVLSKMTNNEQERMKLEMMLSQIPENVNFKSPPAIKDVNGNLTDEKLPKISTSLEVQQSKTSGRYMIAKQGISAGETLVAEEPYASCLLPEKSGTNCHHCMKRLPDTPVFCDTCSSTVFCSTGCKNIAIQSYHRYECKFMDLLIGSGISVLSLIALRIATQNSVDYFRQFDQPSHPFYKIFSMEGHRNTRPAKDYFHRTLASLFLLFVLKKSGFFSQSTESTDISQGLTNDELLLAQVLLKSLQVLQFNAHEIYETIFKTKLHFQSAKINYVGVGVYPTVALFNHDCYPAVTRYFDGRNIVLKSLRPLKAKEAVGENYGYLFTRKRLIERQKILRARYWFQCKCAACEEDWPLMEELEKYPMRIRCSSENCQKIIHTVKLSDALSESIQEKKCYTCDSYSNVRVIIDKILKLNESFYQAIELMNAGRLTEAMEILKEFSDLIHVFLAPPYKLASLAHEALRNCWSVTGNTWTIPETFVKV